MSKKQIAIVGLITLLVVLGSIVYSGYKLFVQKDIMVSSEVWCDPETEGPCYVWVCEPDWWTPCTGDPEEDIWIYKYVEKQAYDMEPCDPVIAQSGIFAQVDEYEYCPDPECTESDKGECTTTYCDPEVDGECYEDDLWDDYVATLRENIEAACGDTYGDYAGVDYCAVLEEMDTAGEEGEGEELEEDATEEGTLEGETDTESTDESVMVEEENEITE